LALLAEDFSLAEKLVIDGANIAVKSIYSLTSMHIINFQELNAIPGELVNTTFKRRDNVDLFLNGGDE
jgi:hypothetical protein